MITHKRITKEFFDTVENLLVGNKLLANPFIKEGDDTYLRYDQIEFSLKNDSLVVNLCWKGKAMYSITLDEAYKLKFGDTVNVVGLEGRTKVRFG